MPFMSQSDAAAARSFSDGINGEGTLMNKHPEDVVLMRVGDVDDVSGAVSVPLTPQEITQGRLVKKEA